MSSIQKITVYLGSSGRCRPVFKDAAIELGQKIGTCGKTLIYGGMDAGLMGILANGALEKGGYVIGIIPKSLQDSQRIHPHLSETILVPDLWERKLKMFRRAQAIIVLPGGFGTIDEALEVLYWANLGLHAKPLVFLNIDHYWDDFLIYLNTLPDLEKSYILVADSVDDIFTKLENWQPPRILDTPDTMPHFEDDILRGGEAPMIFEHATVKDSYILATALGLKQLRKHARPMGLLNMNGQFDALLRWVDLAETERFITDHCKDLFDVDTTRGELNAKLMAQKKILIDLDRDKWGPSETGTHIEVKETKS